MNPMVLTSVAAFPKTAAVILIGVDLVVTCPNSSSAQ
jgi:hypothetical protein